jgi:hypothetical protein
MNNGQSAGNIKKKASPLGGAKIKEKLAQQKYIFMLIISLKIKIAFIKGNKND